jgi:amino acid adenylation domain-containing protein
MSGATRPGTGSGVLYTAPLSFTQAGILFTTLMRPDRPAPCVAAAYRLPGGPNLAGLEGALEVVAGRHAILRTTFDLAGPSQRVHARLPIALRVVDLRRLGPEARAAATAHAAQAKREAFDAGRGPLWRADVIRVREDDSVVLLTASHLVADDVSMAIWVRELRALGAGRAHDLVPLPVQYADYAVWQRGWLDEPAQRPLLDYWQARLAGAPACSALQPDRDLAPGPFPADVTVPLPRNTVDRLRAVAAGERATLFMAGLAVFAELLARRTGQRSVVVGSVVSGRTRPEIARSIGPFADILPFRIDRELGASFRALLRAVRGVVLEGLSHQAAPFARIVERAGVARDPRFAPLAQTGFAAAEVSPAQGPGDTAPRGLATGPGRSPFDLELLATAAAEGGAVTITYRSDLYRPATAELLGREFAALAGAVALAPDRRLADSPTVAGGPAPAAAPRPAPGGRARRPLRLGRLAVPDLVARQAERQPEAPAVAWDGSRLRRGQLLGRADALASRLIEQGAGREVPVGVLLDRSADLLVALLGVMRAGAVYVPLDPDGPPERLRLMVEDLSLRHLVTADDVPLPESPALRRIPVGDAPTPARPRRLHVGLDDAAYVMFTSGSTGRPKGVVVEHRALLGTLLALLEEVGPGPRDRLLAVSPASFDISLLELLLPLLAGGEVVIAPSAATRDGQQLLRVALESGTTVLQATPATWRMLVEADRTCALSLTALCGGDVLRPDLAERLRERGSKQWNLYGPTEATIWASALPLHETAYGRVLIGPPLRNAELHVLDSGLRPVPPGAAGELFIGGLGLARGYLGRPGLTAERFLPGEGGRIYRTGDLVRGLPDGTLEYLGRIDHQVKVRGFRIEPAEVEAALCAHSSVAEAAVVAQEAEAGERQLAAYVRPAGAEPDLDELRSFLRRRLPDHMVPSLYVAVDRFPVTWNGKVDRRRLAPGIGRRLTGRARPTPPATETQHVLAALCADLLALDSVGLDDDFFELGGHSLLTIQLIGRLRERTGVELPLRTVFEQRTVRGLAAAVEAALARGSSPPQPQLVPRARR